MKRVTRLLKALQNEAKGGSEKQNDLPSAENLDMSSIEKASFLQGEEYSSYGNPLHSTALEDESRPEPDRRHKATAGKQADQGKGNEVRGVTETPTRPAGAAKNLKTQQQKNRVQAQKRRGSQTPPEQTAYAPRSQRLQTISESRNNKGKKRAPSKRPGSGSSATDTSPDATHTQSQRRTSLSSENLTDEDESFHPSSKRRTASRASLQRSRSSSQPQRGPKQKRKSSSGSSDSGNPSKKQKAGGGRNPTALDVVFEAFQTFVTQYKETVSSEVVKKAINALSHSFQEDLTEKITAAKEFNNVKRKAVKVNRTLNQKKTRLLEAKNELIKTKAEFMKLEKEHNELARRLTALKQGTAFLNNLKTLNKRYLQHRSAHTEEPETYGPCCLPAMLVEARSITGTEQQLKSINDKLQQVLEKQSL